MSARLLGLPLALLAACIVGCPGTGSGGMDAAALDGDGATTSDTQGRAETSSDTNVDAAAQGDGISPGDATDTAVEAAVDGAAPCVLGEMRCGANCVSVVNNPAHCGTCGNACGATTPVCAGASCATACPAGATSCSGACVDLNTDPTNCGGCGQAVVCHFEVCQAGQHACAPNFTPCGNAAPCLGCKNLDEDIENCGACNHQCDNGQLCSNGQCVAACPLTNTICGGACVPDPQSDLAYCGCTGGPNADVGTACGPGSLCANGFCATYQSAPSCNSCPCSACGSPNAACCSYASETICTAAASCP